MYSNKSDSLTFFKVFLMMVINSFNFYYLAVALVIFVFFNVSSLVGSYADNLYDRIIALAVGSLLMVWVTGYAFISKTKNFFQGYSGILALIIYVISFIILFLIFLTLGVGFVGSSVASPEALEFVSENVSFAFWETFIISFFEWIIFAGAGGSMFMATTKMFKGQPQKLLYARITAIFLIGFFFMIYHGFTTGWNFLALFLIFLFGCFFGVLAWVDELDVLPITGVIVFTTPLKLALHQVIDMFQFGYMEIFAKAISFGLIGA